MLLVSFQYENREYEVIKERSKISFVANKREAYTDEKKLFYYILKQIIPTKKRFINIIVYKEDEYELYIDDIKRIYMFAPFKEAFLVDFNKMFNNQNEYLAVSEGLNDGFKRLASIGGEYVVLYFGSQILLSNDYINKKDTLNEIITTIEIMDVLEAELKEEKVKIEEIDKEFQKEVIKEKKQIDVRDIIDAVEDTLSLDGVDELINILSDDMDGEAAKDLLNDLSGDKEEVLTDVITKEEVFDKQLVEDVKMKLQKSLDLNENLQEEEKEWFLKLEEFINDNISYINLDSYLELLKTKSIKYMPLKEKSLLGANFFDNHIEFYGENVIRKVAPYVVTHELLHDLQGENKFKGYDFFRENMNVLFNNEYFNDADLVYDISYCDTIGYLYALLEIIGSEQLKLYNFNGDIKFIKEALLNIIFDEEKVNRLIELLNVYHLVIKYGLFEMAQAMKWEIDKLISDFYEEKYNRNMKQDLLMGLYTFSISYQEVCEIFNLEARDEYPWLSFTITNLKYYFNSEKIGKMQVEFAIGDIDSNGEYGESIVQVNENNRFLKDSLG